MKIRSKISRREFVGSTLSAAAMQSLHVQPFLRPMIEGRPADPGGKDEGILNVDKSPYAKLHNVPVHAVTIMEGFWGARRETNVKKSLPSMEKLLEANGRMNNYLRLVAKSDAQQSGPVYSDSDVYKWTEAVGFQLQSGPKHSDGATSSTTSAT